MTEAIGILFATKMEADAFLERTPPDHFIVTISGMGIGAACSATRKLIEEDGVKRVVNAGICGALDDTLVRGSVFFVSEVLAEDRCDTVTLQPRPNAKRLVTVNTPVFQIDRKEKLAAFADLVDMEGFGIAQLCQEHNVPCVLIKGVTDFGDPKGKTDIKKHITFVSEKVAEAMLHYLDNHDEHTCHPHVRPK